MFYNIVNKFTLNFAKVGRSKVIKMKKVLTGVLAAVGAVIFGVGVTSMTKKAAAITIIGGADGPTSVFLAGKVGDGFWWLLTVVGGLIIGLSVALFALLVRKKQ